MAEPISGRAYARHRGVHPRAVQKAIASGRITALADGRIDPEAADREWARNSSAVRPSGAPRAVPVPAAAAPSPAAQPPVVGPEGRPAASFAASHAVKEAYLARMAKLDYEERVGRLVDREDVRRQAFTATRVVRDQILAIPQRLKARLAACSDVEQCGRMLKEELEAALRGLKDAMPR